ncbi:MAG: DUF4115 domain-containing protein [Desulfosarcinaceae bacterium]|nr:DUF4115 domain-containing protein [Desulfosarcinaceae bacterium]
MTAVDRSTSNDGAGDGGSFGAFLKAQREASGISLQMVAARTNIQPEILVQIETERLDQLPEPVYIKGFVRAYAEAIGADPREAVLRYERQDAAYRQALTARQFRGRRRLVGRLLLLVVLAGGLALAGFSLLPRGPSPTEAPGPTAAGESTPAEVGAAAQLPAAGGETVAGVAPQKAEVGTVDPQRHMLTAVGLKAATLKVIVDGKRPKVYKLEADTRLEIEAQREFNILLDDARAVTFYLNGQPVAVHGREGQQVTLQLP